MASNYASGSINLKEQLRKCWDTDFEWTLLPDNIAKGCQAVGRLLSVPPLAILIGVEALLSFAIAHAEIKVPETHWCEPSVLWFAIGMPTGTGKSTVYKFLQRILKAVRTELDDNEISYKKWTLSDQTFEKLGELMYQNDSKALGLYDELTNFLSQVNLYSGNKGLLDTHEFTKVLEMFIAAEWSRQTVGGNANFEMKWTCLTLCGLTQPATALPLIVDRNNVDKGLASRFLWIFPKPVINDFASLNINHNAESEEDAKQFKELIVKLLVMIFTNKVGNPTNIDEYEIEVAQDKAYEEAYNHCQNVIQRSCLEDPFLCSLYSKAKGQYLRVALPMHALFLNHPLPEELPKQIPESVIKAAVSLVNLCIQHTAIIAGREVTNGQIGKSTEQQIAQIPLCHTLSNDDKLQQFVLTQPGSIISATRMTNVSKFRNSGGKQKVLMVFTSIVQKNLATVQHKKNNTVFLIKRNPLNLDDKESTEIITSLQSIGISISTYIGAFQNTSHVHAIEDQRKFAGTSYDSPKKRKLHEVAGTSSDDNP